MALQSGAPGSSAVIAAVGLVTGSVPLLGSSAQYAGLLNNLKSATDSFVSWNIANAVLAKNAVATFSSDITNNSTNTGVDALIAFNYANQVATYVAAQTLVRDIVANGCPGTPNIVGTFQASYKAGNNFLNSSTLVINNQFDVPTQSAVNEILAGSMGTGPAVGTSAPLCAGQTNYPYPATTNPPVTTPGTTPGSTTVVNTPAAPSTATTVAVVAGTAVAVTALGVLAAYIIKAGPYAKRA